MTAPTTRSAPRRPYHKHGLARLKAAIRGVGGRVIDQRTTLGKALTRWRADLLQDLGGLEVVSTQERAVVELAVKTKLLLDSVDVWLLTQPSLINRRRRSVFPVVLQRQQLADALARYMSIIGLKRRVKVVDLAAILAEKARENSEGAS